tara:strand:- start:9052 stop:9582 length:531 start_codon:yes stop_codon:yes gene_type:complete
MGKSQDFSTNFVTVGKINQPWGIHGHVKVTPFTDNPKRLIIGSSVYLDSELTEILDVQSPQGYPIIQFVGYENRESAESLLGKLISIENDLLPELEIDTYYIHDLLGLNVMTTEGAVLGKIVDVIPTGANDVYVIRNETKKDYLIPATSEVIENVNIEDGKMTIKVLPGLLPDLEI